MSLTPHPPLSFYSTSEDPPADVSLLVTLTSPHIDRSCHRILHSKRWQNRSAPLISTTLSGANMELSVDVHSTDVFLFPTKRQRQRSSDITTSPTESALGSLSPSTVIPNTGESPAYSELDDGDVFSSTNLSNDDHAVLYAYVDIRFPLPSSSSLASASRIRNRLKSLTLTLTGNESISFPSGAFEMNRTFHDEKSIDEVLDLDYFEPGKTYRFERSFLVDHNAAPFQRSSLGANNQKLVAKATFHSLLSRSMTATKKVYFVDCKSDEGNEMIVWDKDVRTHADGIGPFSLRNRSEVFTVGGYLRTNFDLLSPLDGVRIVGLRAFVEQRATLSSRSQRPGYVETVKPRKERFLDLDRRQIEELFRTKKLQGGGEGVSPDGECYPSLEVVSRLPDDKKIRPSTVDGNDAAIRFRSYIDYEIDFIDGEFRPLGNESPEADELIYVDGQKMKRFHVSIPVVLNSCACRPDSLNLPSYACEDPMPVACIREKVAQLDALHDRQTDPSAFPCICTFTLESLLEVEKKSLAQSHDSDAASSRRSAPLLHDFDPLPAYKRF